MQPHDRTLRIIGGNWRGRKITFPQIDDIRPTGDRVRETLFNWLMHDIVGSHCLDLFAGSGAMGIEALSRGAESVRFVEKNPQIASSIRANLEKLDADAESWQLEVADAYPWVSNQTQPYDIIFLDPPFSDDRIEDLLALIDDNKIAGHYIYIETGRVLDADMLPSNWTVHRQKRSGAVHYTLCLAIND